MIDLSDGLLRDGHRIAEASGVRLALSPTGLRDDHAALEPVVGDAAWECVLAGGEEHSLLATFPETVPEGWRTIGVVEAGEGVTLDGAVQTARGWDHFRRLTNGHERSRPPGGEIGSFRYAAGAGSALDLAGLEARGADVETLRGHTGRANQSLDALDVRVEAALGAAVRE